MEYIFKHDDSFLRKYPGMCEKVIVPEGNYSCGHFGHPCARIHLSIVACEPSRGGGAKRLWDIHEGMAACSVVSVIGVFDNFMLCQLAGLVFYRRHGIGLVIATVALAHTSALSAVD